MMMNDFKELLILLTQIMMCDPNHLLSNSNWFRTKYGPLTRLAKSDSTRKSLRTSSQDQNVRKRRRMRWREQKEKQTSKKEEEQDDGHKCSITKEVCKDIVEEKEEEVSSRRAINMEDEVERNRLFWQTCFEVGYP